MSLEFTIRTDYPFDDDPPPRRMICSDKLHWSHWSRTTAAARIVEEARPGKKDGRTKTQVKKDRRNLVILLCHQVGLSQAVISDVFDIARSQVATIIDATRAKYAAPEAE